MTTQAKSNKNGGEKNDADLEADRVNIFLHAENVRIFQTPQDYQLPVTIVTGFLGSGKTTLLNHILTNKSNLRVAAAINDFAELNIDENLIRHKGTATRLVELSNGCVCCHLLDDLKEAVWRILDRSNGASDLEMDAVNYLVIETSGVSDPVRIIRILDAKFGKCFRARLDSVVTVVDADQIMTTEISSNGDAAENDNATKSATRMSQAALAQLECADIIILNKIDLLKDPKNDCAKIEERIRSVNKNAVIHRTTHCNIPLSAILDVEIPSTNTSQAGPITHEKSHVPIYVSATGGSLRSASSLTPSSSSLSAAANLHLKSDNFVSISVSHSDRPLSLHKLQQFVCSPLVQQLARMKGVVWIQGLEQYRCVIHLSGRGRLGFALDGQWTGPPRSEMAFIGQTSVLRREELQSQFAQCLVADETNNSNSNEKSEDNPHDEKDDGLEALQQHPEFVVLDDEESKSIMSNNHGLVYFRLTGSKVYGYTDEEIEREFRVDTDAMNRDLVDAVNASVDKPKGFLAYTFKQIAQETLESPTSSSTVKTARGAIANDRIALCYSGGEPANNLRVLLREAKDVLATHFRNVQFCKCGA